MKPCPLPGRLAAGLLALSVLTAVHAAQTVDGLLQSLLPTPVLLLGEQHDAPEHQALQREVVQTLAARGLLAAVVLEMLDQGRNTRGLSSNADEATVRSTLQWSDEHSRGWPWTRYGPVVMTAVRAGVPVLGGNLPRERMRAAMADTTLDALLPEPALQQQRENIHSGHCGLLPPSQIAPMTRIQIARDQALARSASAEVLPGKTVLLVAGNGHVRRDLGVPLFLASGQAHRVVMAQAGVPDEAALGQQADALWPTPALAPQDHCAELKKQMGR
jgi:uncharacterized iron-regulated protein